MDWSDAKVIDVWNAPARLILILLAFLSGSTNMFDLSPKECSPNTKIFLAFYGN